MGRGHRQCGQGFPPTGQRPHRDPGIPNDKSEKIWTDADVVAKTGVEPRQVADWLALVGDSVDNIPGVPGVGPKTAAELLRKYGTIEDLYARLAEIKSESQRNALTGPQTL